MLKAHQACIDLKKGVLRIQDREVKFLPEHELPDNARIMFSGHVDEQPGPSTSSAASRGGAGPGQSSFPGSGQTLGTTRNTPVAAKQQSRYPEKDINLLMDLGVSREVAISTLDAAGGNVDVAASLLF